MTRKRFLGVDWVAALKPGATHAEIYGEDSWVARAAANAAADRAVRGSDRGLGVHLDVRAGQVVRSKPRARVPLAAVTAATVTDEPVRFGGALLVGPIGFVRQRGDAYLTITTTGPVWSIPIKHKHVERARQFAARLLTAAHAAQGAEER